MEIDSSLLHNEVKNVSIDSRVDFEFMKAVMAIQVTIRSASTDTIRLSRFRAAVYQRTVTRSLHETIASPNSTKASGTAL